MPTVATRCTLIRTRWSRTSSCCAAARRPSPIETCVTPSPPAGVRRRRDLPAGRVLHRARRVRSTRRTLMRRPLDHVVAAPKPSLRGPRLRRPRRTPPKRASDACAWRRPRRTDHLSQRAACRHPAQQRRCPVVLAMMNGDPPSREVPRPVARGTHHELGRLDHLANAEAWAASEVGDPSKPGVIEAVSSSAARCASARSSTWTSVANSGPVRRRVVVAKEVTRSPVSTARSRSGRDGSRVHRPRRRRRWHRPR